MVFQKMCTCVNFSRPIFLHHHLTIILPSIFSPAPPPHPSSLQLHQIRHTVSIKRLSTCHPPPHSKQHISIINNNIIDRPNALQKLSIQQQAVHTSTYHYHITYYEILSSSRTVASTYPTPTHPSNVPLQPTHYYRCYN